MECKKCTQYKWVHIDTVKDLSKVEIVDLATVRNCSECNYRDANT